jgi:hypothetical protein
LCCERRGSQQKQGREAPLGGQKGFHRRGLTQTESTCGLVPHQPLKRLLCQARLLP